MNDVVTNKGKLSVSEYIDEKVISELRKEYPSVTLKDGISLKGHYGYIPLLETNLYSSLTNMM